MVPTAVVVDIAVVVERLMEAVVEIAVVVERLIDIDTVLEVASNDSATEVLLAPLLEARTEVVDACERLAED